MLSSSCGSNVNQKVDTRGELWLDEQKKQAGHKESSEERKNFPDWLPTIKGAPSVTLTIVHLFHFVCTLHEHQSSPTKKWTIHKLFTSIIFYLMSEGSLYMYMLHLGSSTQWYIFSFLYILLTILSHFFLLFPGSVVSKRYYNNHQDQHLDMRCDVFRPQVKLMESLVEGTLEIYPGSHIFVLSQFWHVGTLMPSTANKWLQLIL